MDREVNLKSVPFDMIKNWLFNIFFFLQIYLSSKTKNRTASNMSLASHSRKDNSNIYIYIAYKNAVNELPQYKSHFNMNFSPLLAVQI